MKILKKGKIWSLKQKCTGKGNGDGGCEAKLLIEKEDIYLTHKQNWYSGEIEFFYTFTCPICKMKTDIQESLLPKAIIWQLDNKKEEIIKRYRK